MKQHGCKQAGVSLHITSLPGRFGIGEIGAVARKFVDDLVEMQIGVWQVLPTGPTAYGNSPYQPLSTFAGNELFIDIGDLIERGLLSDAEVAELAGLPQEYIDFGKLAPIKMELLHTAADRFLSAQGTSGVKAIAEFSARHDRDWLHDYALFRVLKTRHDERPWQEWPEEYVHRDAPALRELEKTAAAEIEAVKVMQFLFFSQWGRLRTYANTRGIRLFGDIPIYIALDSADAWAHPDLLQLDSEGRPEYVAGVPPDYFSEDGQLWGNPLYDWNAHAATGFSWWVERLKAALEIVDLVRIDHFRGFESFWSVPANLDTARHGSWQAGPGTAIFDAMRDALDDLPIVAEDLGIITPAVEALRDQYNIPGMVVLQFSVMDENFRLQEVAENRICYTGTHDNDTSIGWFRGNSNTARAALQLTGGTAETIHNDLIAAAFSTAANIAIAPMQDFLGLGSEARMNTPGTCSNNWRWRMNSTELTKSLKHDVAIMVEQFGRSNFQ
jgi:4-alpha-glucanotransferase